MTTVTREEEKEVRVKGYYHKILEAKLVLASDITISLDREFIENENEDVSKNDCKMNAAKRLLERLGKDSPRLPICQQGDALYAAEPVMEICRNHRWRYILTQKATRQKALAESYEWIARGGGAETVTGIEKERGTGEYVNHVEETAGKKKRICTATGMKQKKLEKRNPRIPVGKQHRADKEKPLSDHTDSGYHDANLFVVQSIEERDRTEHKKYIFMITGKISKTYSNG